MAIAKCPVELKLLKLEWGNSIATLQVWRCRISSTRIQHFQSRCCYSIIRYLTLVVPSSTPYGYIIQRCNLLIVPVRPATILPSFPRYFPHPFTCVTHWRCFGRSLGDDMMQSFWNFEFENGRRYHGYKAGSYPLPNDEVRTTTHLSQMTHCSALSGFNSRRSTHVSLLQSWC